MTFTFFRLLSLLRRINVSWSFWRFVFFFYILSQHFSGVKYPWRWKKCELWLIYERFFIVVTTERRNNKKNHGSYNKYLYICRWSYVVTKEVKKHYWSYFYSRGWIHKASKCLPQRHETKMKLWAIERKKERSLRWNCWGQLIDPRGPRG